MAARITISLAENDFVEIHLNEEGRDLLVRELQRLNAATSTCTLPRKDTRWRTWNSDRSPIAQATRSLSGERSFCGSMPGTASTILTRSIEHERAWRLALLKMHDRRRIA